ncbi:hypothetical protein BDZ97DRAFT_1385784 [Flammula alnicola]|nr:hypothetical protein BDZ97DRAFT_1385784 [Flammula alnicola]
MVQPQKGDHSLLKEQTFKAMRQTIDCIAYACHKSSKDVFLKGPQNQWGIFIRILDVYTVKDGVPLFLFIYKELIPTSEQSMQDHLELFQSDKDSRVTVPISDLERRTWLALFRKNGKRLHPKHQELIDKKGGKQLRIQASFILPLCPFGMRNLGHLTANSGCEFCGKKITSTCMQCLSVVYCGKECQTADWKNHKFTCRSLKGGSWRTITTCGPSLPYRSIINRLDSTHKPPGMSTAKVDQPPPDTHNGKIFLAKFQIPLSSVQAANMLVYDRQRSFQMFWKRSSDPKLFDEARKMIGDKLIFYR